ncbi:hypothetical protein GQ44DRAFT_708846 [Phaeosphaeriaceae sp. PMI808]|nr:hypothetical protein GQ44DRAFT_708846 [Phaeosphaeriaceae sp. PMI808]
MDWPIEITGEGVKWTRLLSRENSFYFWLRCLKTSFFFWLISASKFVVWGLDSRFSLC